MAMNEVDREAIISDRRAPLFFIHLFFGGRARALGGPRREEAITILFLGGSLEQRDRLKEARERRQRKKEQAILVMAAY